MTKRKAKSISLKVWGYLKEHGECKAKIDMPREVRHYNLQQNKSMVKGDWHECP